MEKEKKSDYIYEEVHQELKNFFIKLNEEFEKDKNLINDITKLQECFCPFIRAFQNFKNLMDSKINSSKNIFEKNLYLNILNHIESIKIYIENFILKPINEIDFSNKLKYFITLLPLLSKGHDKDSNEIMLFNFIEYFYKDKEIKPIFKYLTGSDIIFRKFESLILKCDNYITFSLDYYKNYLYSNVFRDLTKITYKKYLNKEIKDNEIDERLDMIWKKNNIFYARPIDERVKLLPSGKIVIFKVTSENGNITNIKIATLVHLEIISKVLEAITILDGFNPKDTNCYINGLSISQFAIANLTGHQVEMPFKGF